MPQHQLAVSWKISSGYPIATANLGPTIVFPEHTHIDFTIVYICIFWTHRKIYVYIYVDIFIDMFVVCCVCLYIHTYMYIYMIVSL